MPKIEERYWVCLTCGLELHGIPEGAEPTKCGKCGGTSFQKMKRVSVSLKEWDERPLT